MLSVEDISLPFLLHLYSIIKKIIIISWYHEDHLILYAGKSMMEESL